MKTPFNCLRHHQATRRCSYYVRFIMSIFFRVREPGYFRRSGQHLENLIKCGTYITKRQDFHQCETGLD